MAQKLINPYQARMKSSLNSSVDTYKKIQKMVDSMGGWFSRKSDFEDYCDKAGLDLLEYNAEYAVVADAESDSDKEYEVRFGGTGNTVSVEDIVELDSSLVRDQVTIRQLAEAIRDVYAETQIPEDQLKYLLEFRKRGLNEYARADSLEFHKAWDIAKLEGWVPDIPFGTNSSRKAGKSNMRKVISKKGRLNSSKSVFDTKNIADTLQTIWDEDPGTGHHSNAWYKKELEKRGCKVPADSEEFAKVLDEAWDLAEAGDRAQDADLDSGCHGGKRKMNSSRFNRRRLNSSTEPTELDSAFGKPKQQAAYEKKHAEVLKSPRFQKWAKKGLGSSAGWGSIPDSKWKEIEDYFLPPKKEELEKEFGKMTDDVYNAYAEAWYYAGTMKGNAAYKKLAKIAEKFNAVQPILKDIQGVIEDAKSDAKLKSSRTYSVDSRSQVLNSSEDDAVESRGTEETSAEESSGTVTDADGNEIVIEDLLIVQDPETREVSLFVPETEDEAVPEEVDVIAEVIEADAGALDSSRHFVKSAKKLNCSEEVDEDKGADAENVEESEIYDEIELPSGDVISVEDILVVQDEETKDLNLFIPESEEDQVPEGVEVIGEAVAAGDEQVLDSSRRLKKFQNSSKLNSGKKQLPPPAVTKKRARR